MVYIFGGQLVKDGSVSNELFWMTSERMEWHAQPTRGDRPAGRHGHVAVYDPDHHQLVIFGGRCVSRLDPYFASSVDAGCEWHSATVVDNCRKCQLD